MTNLGAREILLGIALVFAVLSALRWWRHGGTPTIQERTWLGIAVIFAAVSAFLWLSQP